MSHARRLRNWLRINVDPITWGAEIGVWEGKTSHTLLTAFPNLTLIMVDPWDESEKKGGGMTRGSWRKSREALRRALHNTRKQAGRTHVMKMFSVEAAKKIEDESLDFVFIDALHDYPHVKEDIEVWFPKVRPGGGFTGHDYGKKPGVKQAVDEFIAKTGHQLNLLRGSVWAIEK